MDRSEFLEGIKIALAERFGEVAGLGIQGSGGHDFDTLYVEINDCMTKEDVKKLYFATYDAMDEVVAGYSNRYAVEIRPL